MKKGKLTLVRKIRDNIYCNNGIYKEPFYKRYPGVALLGFEYDHASIIRTSDAVLIQYWKKYYPEIENIFWNKITETEQNGFFVTTEVFNEEVAMECGLIPFQDICDGPVLACPDGEISRLDAYQVLTDKTIDRESIFFSNPERFEFIVGKEVVDRMNNILYIIELCNIGN